MGQLTVRGYAEYGLGMFIAQDTLRHRAQGQLKAIAEKTENADIKAKIDTYFETANDGKANAAAKRISLLLLKLLIGLR